MTLPLIKVNQVSFDFINQMIKYESTIIEIIVIVAIIIIIDRIIIRKTKTIARTLHISVQSLRSVVTLLRFALLAILLFALATVEFLPTEYFVGAGALIGTAIGFGMSRYISNFASGAYILFSGLYKIGDYVRIGSEEGIVIDMSVNYTKLKREDDTVLVISNQTILNQSVVNFRVKGEDYFVYPISVSFDLKYSWSKIRSVLDSVIKEVKNDVKDISYEIKEVTRLEVKVNVIISVARAESIPELKAKILDLIMNLISEQ